MLPGVFDGFVVEAAFDLLTHHVFTFVALAVAAHEQDVVTVRGTDGFADAAVRQFGDGLGKFAAELFTADPAEVAAFGCALAVFGVAAGEAGKIRAAL